MSEQRPHQRDPADDAEMAREEPFNRPLPDGGLAESMPDWLRRPPAWRDSTARRSAAPPPPDTSPIDPRTLIDVEDLPPWLQRIAQRAEERSRAPVETIQVEGREANASPRVEPIIDPHRVGRTSPPPETQMPETPVRTRTTVRRPQDRSTGRAGDHVGPPRHDEEGAPQDGPKTRDRELLWLVVAVATLLAVLVLIALLVLDVMP